MIGRRWAFLPGTIEVAQNRASTNESSDQFSFRSTNRNFQSQDKPDPITNPSRPDGRLSLGLRVRGDNVPRKQVLIVENLMLQRLVEAIRVDPSDDGWTISGEVIEFFDQNRLIIRTAQRSNAK